MTYIKRAILALVLIAGFSPAIAQVPPAVPALPDTERRTSYSISASTCSCAVNFAIFGDGVDYQNWVEVFINGTRVNYNDATYGWTITSPSGSLSSLSRPITNAVLTFTSAQTGTVQIVGARRPRRTSQFNESAGVPTRNFNQVLTDIIAQNREIWDKTNDMTGRGLFSQPGVTLAPLPLPAACSGAFLGFDGSGLNPTCYNPLSTAASLFVGVNGANPLILPGQWEGNPITASVAVGGQYTANACPTCTAIQQISAWGATTGTEHLYALFGQVQANAAGSNAWASNLVAYAQQGGTAVGMEIDFGVTDLATHGPFTGTAYGLALNAAGTTGSNFVVGLQLGSLGVGGQMTHGILFGEWGGIGIFQQSLISSSGPASPTHLIDFSTATPVTDSLLLPGGFVVDKNGHLAAPSLGLITGASAGAGTIVANSSVGMLFTALGTPSVYQFAFQDHAGSGLGGWTTAGTWVPNTNNSVSLGDSSHRWSNVFSVLGNYSGQITSSVATGTAPLAVTSTTRVANLNAATAGVADTVASGATINSPVLVTPSIGVDAFRGMKLQAVGTPSVFLVSFANSSGTDQIGIDNSGNLLSVVSSALGSSSNRWGTVFATDLRSKNAAAILHSDVAITGGATGNVPTLTAGPVTGNPTKWLPYDDNGTTRYIPAW